VGFSSLTRDVRVQRNRIVITRWTIAEWEPVFGALLEGSREQHRVLLVCSRC